MSEKCPDCGEGFDTPHYKRLGWHYARCNRRWHETHGWETMAPRGCLRRQLAQRDEQLARLKAIVEKLWRRLGTPIVCLCGSTRFIDDFDEAALQLTLRGIIVLSVGSHKPRSRDFANDIGGHKAGLDTLHKRKIDLADSVFVLNVDDYVGDSTRSEIAYAEAQEKPIGYWSGCDITGDPASWDEIAKSCREAAEAEKGEGDAHDQETD